MKIVRDDENRRRFFSAHSIDPLRVVSASQVHSRTVHVAETASDLAGYPPGDGVITVNRSLVPCVTVADCMPVFLFDPVSGCFGALHSGWKGTGIIGEALAVAGSRWGAKPENFRVILGPHIRDCCYTVDAARADYFAASFGPSCVCPDASRIADGSEWPYRLSLAEANLQHCLSLGIRPDHIADTGDCTSCKDEYGSNRREGADSFTHMVAFLCWD
jgi:YfiH family protein